MSANLMDLKTNGFLQQRQKDRFSLRLKVVGGNLTADQLLIIAQAAKKYGDGHVHLTSRQSVEIPFVSLEDTTVIVEELRSQGVETGACGARVRTVTACQGSAVCRHGCVDTYALALAVEERYRGQVLPHKCKIGITGCANNCLKAEQNDIGVKGGYRVTWDENACTLCGACIPACRHGAITGTDGALVLDEGKCAHCGRCVLVCPTSAWEGEPGYFLSFGGLFGNTIAPGKNLVPMLANPDQVLRVIDAAVGFFVSHAKKGQRLRFAIEQMGWEQFASEMARAAQVCGR